MITVDNIMARHPCAEYDRTTVESLVGDGLTPQGVAAQDIPAQDRLWVLLTCAMTTAQRGVFAAACAEQAQTLVGNPDSRSVSAAATAKSYAQGQTTKEALIAARISANAAVATNSGSVGAAANVAAVAVNAAAATKAAAATAAANAAFNAGVTWEWQLAKALEIIG